MSFDPTKPQPWDIYTYKVRPGFTASAEPIDRDILHARSLGIADWSPSDTALCETQAEVGRKAYEKTATAIHAYNAELDRKENAGFYRRENGGQKIRNEDKSGCRTCQPLHDNALVCACECHTNGGQAVADFDALVNDTNGYYVIHPVTREARTWFTIHYSQCQDGLGDFTFAHSEILEVAKKASTVRPPLRFGKRDY